MPLADAALINRANTTLANGNYNQKLALLQEVPICPPSNYQGGAHRFTVTEKSPFANDTRDKKYLTKKKITADEDCIAFIKFNARTETSGEPGSVSFELKYAEDLPSDAARSGYIPVWFLPWESGFMWKLKIPNAATSPTIQLPPAHTTPIPNPDIFFTAAINGCSVFARGQPNNPKIYHGGAEQAEISAVKSELGNAFWQRIGGNAEGLWLNLFRGFDERNALPNQRGDLHLRNAPPKANDATAGEINKSHYILETTDGNPMLSPLSMEARNPLDKDKPTTVLAAQLEQYLLRTEQTINVESVAPWGCVFGVRNGSNWEFYLQTNATVKYYTINKIKKFGRSTKTQYGGFNGSTYDALGKPQQWGKGTSLHLGTKQFFPGNGHGHVRADWGTFRFT